LYPQAPAETGTGDQRYHPGSPAEAAATGILETVISA
jgi:hypothetical protein